MKVQSNGELLVLPTNAAVFEDAAFKLVLICMLHVCCVTRVLALRNNTRHCKAAVAAAAVIGGALLCH